MKSISNNLIHIPINADDKDELENGKYWILVVIFVFLSGFLSYCGFYIEYTNNPVNNQSISIFDLNILYQTFQLFVLNYPSNLANPNWLLNIMRFFPPLVTLGSILLLLSSLIMRVIRLQKIHFLEREHIIICGLTTLGIQYAKNFIKQGKTIIIIDPDPDENHINEIRSERMILITADPGDPHVLSDVRVDRASHLLAVFESDDKNIDIAYSVRIGGTFSSLKCLINISDPEICQTIQMRSDITPGIHYEIFNQYLIAGVRMIHKFLPNIPGNSEDGQLKIMIVGGDEMVKTMILELARLYKNYQHQEKDSPLCSLTLVDPDASSISEYLKIRYPEITTIFEISAKDKDPTSVEFLQIDSFHNPEIRPDIIYICMPDDTRSYRTAILANSFLNIRPSDSMVKIVIRCRNIRGLETFIEEVKQTRTIFRNIEIFPYLEETCNLEWLNIVIDIELVAQAIHKDYCLNQRLIGKTPDTNESIRPWEEIPDSLKESNRDQAKDILNKLESVGYKVVYGASSADLIFRFSENELEYLSEREHERWMEERLANGWVLGEVKDLDRKVNPYLIPYSELDDDVKEWDRQTIRVIPGVLASIGLAIVKDE